MSDDEADPELLELLRKSLGISAPSNEISPDTKVLRHAEFIYGNSIDVAIDMRGTVAAAAMIREQMQQRSYSTKAWAEHELHPKAKDEATANFIFTMDLLNFSFWSELDEEQRFSVVYRGKRWTGYWSLVACLQRALDEGIPITSPWFWSTPTSGEPLVVDEARAVNGEVHQDDHLANHAIEDEVMQHQPADEAPVYSTLAASDSMDLEASHLQAVQAGSDEAEDVDTNTINAKVDNKQLTAKLLAHVFRSATEEQIPMFSERLECLREAGAVLRQHFVGSVLNLIQSANGSAGMLVNLLSYHFDCFRDETTFDRRIVQIMKRAQIFVADLWAAFDGQGCGEFYDIDKITMFADYRVPQMLHSLGCLSFSPPLDYAIRNKRLLASGHPWEVQLRGCSIWCVELLRREILKLQPDAQVNAILIDFFLYDLAKERERAGEEAIPHHRTRSIWY